MRKLPIVVLEHSTSLVPSVYIMSLITQSHYPFHSHKIQHMQGEFYLNTKLARR
ncbi:hypothetical protein HanRHA438_Chr08g0358391 [Helianthus annuus]|nr:hypothetical protein HanHA89_Chr08g0304101 [Helianthus annuus]KAJ0571035.1 hypothetical protein HanHA300_Chr05g0184991 [Helianthus annuus]KAJ0578549.1 hypothetical protein HanIR_Chr05g0249131 [Helianthus annuus]KAJ0898576.1 hypothetical protein HanRHA438_Chr08g0358391 [Helianthus annuus]